MNRFFEYTINHPFLVAAAAILAVLAIVFEMRHRARGASSIGTADAVRLQNSGALLLDVRDGKDYEAGHIIEARHIPATEIASRAESLKKFKEKPVIVYCDGGFTSAGAARQLRASGFNKVVTLSGGLNSWRQDNLPLVKGAARKDGKPA
jgi:rhodanese-related sulfurtransferase